MPTRRSSQPNEVAAVEALPDRFATELQAEVSSLGLGVPREHWHHIVEQHDHNKKKFTEKRLDCEDNLIAIDKEIHYKLGGHYSKLRPGTSRQTVREWLRVQEWAKQREYGLDRLRRYGISP